MLEVSNAPRGGTPRAADLPPLGAQAIDARPRLFDAPMAPTLTDHGAEERFRRDGYVVIDFLDPSELMELRELCEFLHDEPETTWQSDFYSADVDLKRVVHREIGDLFARAIGSVFSAHRSLLHNFVLNWPGPDGGLQLHQHSSLVDEQAHRSALVWCALRDTTEQNSTLHVVPRSHRFQIGPRPERTASWLDDHLDRLLEHHLVSVPVRAGQALIFDNQLLHCSFSNGTEACRRVAAAVVVPEEATPLYFDPIDERTAQVHRLDPELFLTTQARDLQWVRPEGLELVGEVEWVKPVVSAAHMHEVLATGTCSHPRGSTVGTPIHVPSPGI